MVVATFKSENWQHQITQRHLQNQIKSSIKEVRTSEQNFKQKNFLSFRDEKFKEN
jgi:hypothetical protein